MFIARDSFLYSLSYELSKMAHFAQFIRLKMEESLWAINISCLTALFPTDSCRGAMVYRFARQRSVARFAGLGL